MLRLIFVLLDGMSDAWASAENLPRALFVSGGVETLLALAVYIFRPPQGIFVSHAMAYRVTLICAAVWGVVPMVAGIWFAATELRPRAWCLAAVVILGITVLPLLIVLALCFGPLLAVKAK